MGYGMTLTCTQKLVKYPNIRLHSTLHPSSFSVNSLWLKERQLLYLLTTPATVSSITCVIHLFRVNPHWRQMLSEMTRLLTLYLCIPVISCTAERNFSSLWRLKTFLRSTMSQERLNHVAVLHVHKDLTDNINLHELCNDFISRNDMFYDV